MKRKPIYLIVSGVLIVAVAAAGGTIFYRAKIAKAATVSYITGTARIGNVEKSISATGTIQPLNQYDLSSNAGGKVTEVDVKVGDQVKSGQILAKVDPTQAQQQVDQAQLTLNQATIKLNQLYTPPSQVNVLNSQSAVLKAQSAADSALSNLQTLESYKNAATLKAAIQKQQSAGNQGGQNGDLQDYLDNPADLTSAINQASLNYQLAEAELKSAQAQAAQTSSAPSGTDVQLAQNQVDQAQTALTTAQAALDSTVIKAPADGTITAVNAKVGQSSSGGSSAGSSSAGNSQGSGSGSSLISMIGDSGTMQVVVPVNQVDISKVSVGQAANITLDAYPGDNFSGTVTAVSPVGSSQSGVTTFAVTINVTNKDNEMKSGMSANITIIVAQKENVLTIPSAAVHTAGSRTTVSVLNSGSSTPVMQTIQTGLDDGKNVEVLQGLQEGDKIVIGVRSNLSQSSQAASGTSINRMLGGSAGAGSFGGGNFGGGAGAGITRRSSGAAGGSGSSSSRGN